MKNTKTLLAAALIAACAISQPVLAQVADSAPPSAPNSLALESIDLNFAFEQTTQPLQMAMLSKQEMEETEGEFWPVFVYYYALPASSFAMTMWQSSAYMPLAHAVNGVQSWWARR